MASARCRWSHLFLTCQGSIYAINRYMQSKSSAEGCAVSSCVSSCLLLLGLHSYTSSDAGHLLNFATFELCSIRRSQVSRILDYHHWEL